MDDGAWRLRMARLGSAPAMRAVALVIVVLLTGCAGMSSDVGGARDSWQGAVYDEVVLRWGTPARSTTLTDGREAYTWMSEGTVSGGSFFPSIGLFGGSGGVGVGTGVTVGSGSEVARCERTLFFRNGRVVDQLWQGHEHYCGTLRRK